jgi:hypothetical protein
VSSEDNSFSRKQTQMTSVSSVGNFAAAGSYTIAISVLAGCTPNAVQQITAVNSKSVFRA